MSNRNYIEEADVVTDRYFSALADIANDRLNLAIFEMEGKLKGPLEIIFDMGAESIMYQGCNVQFLLETMYRKWSLKWAPHGTMKYPDDCWDASRDKLSQPSELRPLGEALNDIYNILDGYSNGPPNNIKVNQ